jgi:hypothetical protein
MENVDKLLIITSQNGPEYLNYWDLLDVHPIVKNGRNIDNESEFLNETIDTNGYLVMIHDNKSPRCEERKIIKENGQEFIYYVYYYTTLDELLNGNLWTIGDGYSYNGGDDPKCPFDKLRMAINNNGETSPIVKEIIEWVRKKCTTSDLLELKLGLLHQCLTKEGVNKVLKEKIHEKIGLDENLVRQLSNITDPFSVGYLAKLTEIRDKVLADNLK